MPVPMRVDQAEKEKADAGRALAMRSFRGLPRGMSESKRRGYWTAVEVPYQAFYAYEETLATFGDEPGLPQSLLAAYERLASVITTEETRLPAMADTIRTTWKKRYERRASSLQLAVLLRYTAEDALWAEWIGQILTAADVDVVDQGPIEED